MRYYCRNPNLNPENVKDISLYFVREESILIINEKYEKDETYETLLDYDKIKNMWNIKDLTRICELYDSCFVLYNDTTTTYNKIPLINSYLKSVNSILDIADNEFQKLILNSNNG